MEPIVFEQSGLYVFRREVFVTQAQRISSNPFIKLVNAFEGHDIDTLEDFQLAELILEKQLVR